MARVKVEQLVLIGGKTKKIALLLNPLDRRTLRTYPLSFLIQLRFILIVIGLVAYGIPARIFVEVNIARGLHALPDSDGCAMMALLRSSDERIIRAIEARDHGLKTRHVSLHQVARRQFLFRSSLEHFAAVLVRAGEEQHIISIEPHETSNRVGRDR